jgi:hypothetical protein
MPYYIVHMHKHLVHPKIMTHMSSVHVDPAFRVPPCICTAEIDDIVRYI